MPIQQLIDSLESLQKDFPDAEIVNVEQFLEDGNWKYRTHFYSGEDLYYIEVK